MNQAFSTHKLDNEKAWESQQGYGYLFQSVTSYTYTHIGHAHAVVRQLLHTVQLPSIRAFHVQLVHDPSNITLQPCILTWQCFLHPQVSENSCELWQQKKVIIFLSLDVM